MIPCYHSYKSTYYPLYYPLPYSQYIVRSFPPVNPSIFMSSAKQMEILMGDASMVLKKMSNSRSFSYELMSAAQKSNHKRVNELIRSTGISTIPEVKYTPDGLGMNFTANSSQAKCCQLSLTLRWY